MLEEVFRIPLLIPMRDGVRLAADLYTTQDPAHLKPEPVLLQRTCYDRYTSDNTTPAQYLARKGYSTVVQACRGRNESEGEWVAGEAEAEDGYDTIEWLATQNFSNGKVGTYGGSYPGWIQMAAESLSPPSLKAMVVTSGYMQTMRAHGRDGDILLPRSLLWVQKMSDRNMRPRDTVNWDEILRTLPLIDATKQIPESQTMWSRWMENTDLPDPVAADTPHKISVPTLHVTGWDDEPGQSHVYRRAVDSGSEQQYLMVGPWDHPGTRRPQQVTKGYDHGPQSVVDIHATYARWFDYVLRDGEAFAETGNAAVFTTGVNEWRTYSEWPRYDAEKISLNMEAGNDNLDGRLSVEPKLAEAQLSIHHDPMDPVMQQPMTEYLSPNTKNEISGLEIRKDVLSFTTGPIESAMTIDGYITFRFMASATAESADWCVWVGEVDEVHGTKRLASSMTRVENPANEVNEITVVAGPISHVVGVGRELKCYIAGSHFPVWNPNLGIKGFDAHTSEYVESDNTIHLGPDSPGTVTVDVIPETQFTRGLFFSPSASA